jgi:hypothetical protein
MHRPSAGGDSGTVSRAGSSPARPRTRSTTRDRDLATPSSRSSLVSITAPGPLEEGGGSRSPPPWCSCLLKKKIGASSDGRGFKCMVEGWGGIEIAAFPLTCGLYGWSRGCTGGLNGSILVARVMIALEVAGRKQIECVKFLVAQLYNCVDIQNTRCSVQQISQTSNNWVGIRSGAAEKAVAACFPACSPAYSLQVGAAAWPSFCVDGCLSEE